MLYDKLDERREIRNRECCNFGIYSTIVVASTITSVESHGVTAPYMVPTIICTMMAGSFLHKVNRHNEKIEEL